MKRAGSKSACFTQSSVFDFPLPPRYRDEIGEVDSSEEGEEEELTAQEVLNLGLLDSLIDDDLEAMREWRKRGADVGHHNKDGHETPLHFAVCKSGGGEIVDWLLSEGADVNARAEHEMTPLHWAVRL